jgi:hypothetical protein
MPGSNQNDDEKQESLPAQQEGEESQDAPAPLLNVRRRWYRGEWYYAVVDMIALFTGSSSPYDYWRKMKARADPGLRAVLDTQIVQFRLKAADNRFRLTDTANRETILRIVQDLPSKHPTDYVESIKLWLAKLGEERLEEGELSPEEDFEKLREDYLGKGYPAAWDEERLKYRIIRNELTFEWRERGAEDSDFPVLTNELTKRTFGLPVKAYKRVKLISERANLQDNMTPTELAFSSLASATAIEYHQRNDSQGLEEIGRDVREAGDKTGEVRKFYEKSTGISVVSSQNARDFKQVKGGTAQQQALPPPKKPEQPTLFDEPSGEEGQ